MTRPIQSAAEGMPKISRRTALASIAATIAAPAAVADAGGSALDGLLVRHAKAMAESMAAWDRVGEIEDGPTLRALQPVRVQLGDLPIFARTEEAIERHFAVSDPWRYIPANARKRPHNIEARRRWQQALNAKLGEFREKVARDAAIEDATGLGAAVDAAKRSQELVLAVEQAIIAHIPQTLTEAAQKARWCLTSWDNPHSGLHHPEFGKNALLEALTAIAAADAVHNNVENGDNQP